VDPLLLPRQKRDQDAFISLLTKSKAKVQIISPIRALFLPYGLRRKKAEKVGFIKPLRTPLVPLGPYGVPLPPSSKEEVLPLLFILLLTSMHQGLLLHFVQALMEVGQCYPSSFRKGGALRP